jgi:SP family sugar:H+ symporter-like MFS transporter
MSQENGSRPVDDGEERRRTTTKVVLISVVAAIGGFLFGFDTSVVNGAVDAVAEEFSLAAGLKGFAVSCALLGAAAGAWFAGRLAGSAARWSWSSPVSSSPSAPSGPPSPSASGT